GRENRAVRRRGEGEPGGRGVGGAGLPKREGKQRDQDNRTMNPHVSPSYARSILTAHRCLRAYLDFVARAPSWERDRLARPIGVPRPGSASILLAPVSGSRAGNRVVAPGGSGGWVGRPWRWRASASRVPTCGCLALPGRRWRSEARLALPGGVSRSQAGAAHHTLQVRPLPATGLTFIAHVCMVYRWIHLDDRGSCPALPVRATAAMHDGVPWRSERSRSSEAAVPARTGGILRYRRPFLASRAL